MNTVSRRLVPLCLLLGAVHLTAQAASASASSASEGSSASVGSVSTSLRKSSDGSSKATGLAQGDYRIVEVAAVAGQPDQLRLTLQAVADPGEGGRVWLDLPQQTAAQHALAAGQVVNAAYRPYGIAFAKAGTHETFFLVLEDDWYRELPSRPVTL